MSGFRLEDGNASVGLQTISFSFDGKSMQGLPGDTLASALLANGVSLFGRSFKYHRPRGLLSAGWEEPNALVTLGTGARAEPNIPATTIELFAGLTAVSQNRWPSLAFDAMSITGLASPMLSAGFYYKTFMGPTKRAWMWFEPMIRRAAGLGSAPSKPDPDSYAARNHFTDVLVVGAGPAGIAAALAAAQSGARVTLAEQSSNIAGSGDLATWTLNALADLKARGVLILPRTTVFGLYDGTTLGAIERVADHLSAPLPGMPRQRFWTIRARQIVLATGALERPLVFAGNDRPGVMLADAVRRYAVDHAVAAGREVTVFTNNDSAYSAAAAMHRAGVRVRAVIDQRRAPSATCVACAKALGAEMISEATIVATHGRPAMSAISVRTADGRTRRIASDCLATSGGWTPVVHLASQTGAPPTFDTDLGAFVPGTSPRDCQSAGSARGLLQTADCLSDGATAGAEAATRIGLTAVRPDLPAIALHPVGLQSEPLRAIVGRQKAFVDFQNDVTAADILQAHAEGFQAVEHLKRYTTLGMGTDQGKTSNINAIRLMAAATGCEPAAVGATRFRPPFTPVSLGALAGPHAGHHLQPARRTPMQGWHEANGGLMTPVGTWHRPRAYLREGETLHDAYIREARSVRNAAGLCDVSTLGKIDVQGPDSAQFLDRVYSNPMASLSVGKARYGVMLREDGMMFDDGTVWRLADHRYLITTTTGGAGAVMLHLESLLALHWPELRVCVTSTTTQWAGMSLAGPRARDVLARVTDADISAQAIPFMGIAQARAGEIPLTIARLSFSGELAFELFTPSTHGVDLWGRVIEAGKPLGLVPYGIEALGALRIEKGHVAGAELDGRVSPHNLGLSTMLSKRKAYIGSALANREGLLDRDRYELVGLLSVAGTPLQAGAHVVTGSAGAPGPSQGFVSSVTYSVAFDREIALALVKGGKSRIGQRLFAADPVRGKHHAVDCVDPHFLDPKGERMKDD